MKKSVLIGSWLWLIIFLCFRLISCSGGSETSQSTLPSETAETFAEPLISNSEESTISDEPSTSDDSENLPEVFLSETVFFSPQRLKVEPNSEFSLDIEISQVDDVFGISLYIIYDPNLFEYRGASKGDFFSQDGCQTPSTARDFPPGVLVFGLTRDKEESGAVSGAGWIATLTFKSYNQTGESEISFSRQTICILEEDGLPSFKGVEQRAALIEVQ